MGWVAGVEGWGGHVCQCYTTQFTVSPLEGRTPREWTCCCLKIMGRCLCLLLLCFLFAKASESGKTKNHHELKGQERTIAGETVNQLSSDYLQSTFNPTPQQVRDWKYFIFCSVLWGPLLQLRHQLYIHATVWDVNNRLCNFSLQALYTVCPPVRLKHHKIQW